MPLNVSLLDVVQFDGFDGGQELLDECMESCPTVSGYDVNYQRQVPIAVEETSDDVIKSMLRTGLPKVQPFRIANKGVKPGKGKYEKRIVELATCTSTWFCDRSIIDKNRSRGVRYMEEEGKGTIRANILALENQFFYGRRTDHGGVDIGFQGLHDFCDPERVHDAGGTGTDLASIWFVFWNTHNGVSWVYGKNGSITLSEPKLETAYDDDKGVFEAYRQFMEFYPAVKMMHKDAVYRIANVKTGTANAGAIDRTVLTDVDMRRALMSFHSSMRPKAIYMPRQCGLLLAASRNTVSIANSKQAGVLIGQDPPPPDNFDGIPVVYTDQLLTNEPQYIKA
ncbi:MAG: hypothetical protein FWD31_02095 [Planctomycetaceae bacterium]|nr:hypothetical protein [Planctomycetaceae bacterium]